MALFGRKREPQDRVTAEALVDFGRFTVLGEQSGVDGSVVFHALMPLHEQIFSGEPEGRAAVVAELGRHAGKGEWEKVGAWKYVREMLDEASDTRPLIDVGLLALDRMRMTNLAIHLAPVDTPRYEELVGHRPPNDGFFGPPVFDSEYGPTRQYYFDDALAHSARRTVRRLESVPGVLPGPMEDAVRAMWDFGLLVHRGPLLVNPDLGFEPNVVGPAVAAADRVDHDRFCDLVVERVLDPSTYLYGVWSTLGAARFVEDYLHPDTIENPSYARVLDEGLNLGLDGDVFDVSMPAEILTPRQSARLERERARRATGAT